MPSLTLQLVPGEFAACRLPPTTVVPAWGTAGPFSSMTRTADELSLICLAADVPTWVQSERGWSLLKFSGPFDFNAVGILASVTAPLAESGISLLAIGTFETDYVLVKSERLEEASGVLIAAGHKFLPHHRPEADGKL